jgi:hypothetical protein
MRIAICNLPAWNLQYPAGAPATLKSIAVALGHECRTFDFAYDLFNGPCERDMAAYDALQSQLVTPSYWDRPVRSIDQLLLGSNGSQPITDWVTWCVDRLAAYQPDMIGLSVFSYWSHKSTMLMATEIRRRMPGVTLLLGGRGTSSPMFGADSAIYAPHMARLSLPGPDRFSTWMLSARLADLVLEGDAESSFGDLLRGDHPNTDITAIDMNAIPYADFDDYDLAGYPYPNSRALPISASKGCVRACTFCDVPKIWPKFLYKDGNSFADEMKCLTDRYKAREFYVTDSLANGSMTAFMRFLRQISEDPVEGRTWTGHYITRPAHQLPADYYPLLSASGAQGLSIGVETGSDRVRDQMKKKFSSEDLDREMAQFNEHGITAVLLFFSGYPTETWTDFLDTLRMFRRYQEYAASGTLQKVSLGTPYQYSPDTPMDDLIDKYGMVVGAFGDLWVAGTNSDLHYLERVRRRMIMQEVCCLLNLPVSRNYYELLFILNTMQSRRSQIIDFYGLKDYSVPLYQNVTGDPRLGHTLLTPTEVQLEIMRGTETVSVEIEVEVETDEAAWVPVVEIQIGEKIVRQHITARHQVITLQGRLARGDRFSVGLVNQPVQRTYFWSGGDDNHYSCKQVLLKRLEINGIDLVDRGHLERHFQQTLLVTVPGESHIRNLFSWPQQQRHLWRLWTNMTVSVEFEQNAMVQLCGWQQAMSPDQIPDWDMMWKLGDYLVDFVGDVQL